MDAILHVEHGADPVAGWLKPAAGSASLAFTGYTELLALLERLRETTTEPAQAGEGQDQA